MRWLTEDAVIVCKHELGRAANVPSQDLVRVDGRAALVAPDPEARSISGCPNFGPAIKPCLLTLKVTHGYSAWVFITGQPLCLETVTGLTDGTPPGVVKYEVRRPGQDWVDER